MSYLTYKFLHLAGILVLFVTAGGVALYAANGGTKEGNTARAWVSVLHGLSLVVILVSGFGLVARIESGFAPWVWAKFALWFVLGSFALLPLRRQSLGMPFYFLVPALGMVAAYLALFKPF